MSSSLSWEKIGVVATVIGTLVAVLGYFSIMPSSKTQSAVSSNTAVEAIDQGLALTRQISMPSERDEALSKVAGQALQADLPRKAIEITGMMISAKLKDRTLKQVTAHATGLREYKLAEEAAKAISDPHLRDRAMRLIVEHRR